MGSDQLWKFCPICEKSDVGNIRTKEMINKTNQGIISYLSIDFRNIRRYTFQLHRFLCVGEGANRMAEVAREHGWHPPKSLDSDKNLSPNIRYFVANYWFVAIYALFGDLWAKKCLFGQKQGFLGKKCTITWYILHIILSKIGKFAITRKTTRLSRNSNYALYESFYGYFCPRRKAANFCHPARLFDPQFTFKSRMEYRFCGPCQVTDWNSIYLMMLSWGFLPIKLFSELNRLYSDFHRLEI